MKTGLSFEVETLFLFCGWGYTILGGLGLWLSMAVRYPSPQLQILLLRAFAGSFILGISILTFLYIWSWSLSK